MIKIYSVYDRKAAFYGRPFYTRCHAEATRQLQVAVNDNQIQLGMFPEDYDLYYFGEFDDQNAQFDILKKPEFVVSAVSLKKMEEKNEQKAG